MKLVVKSGATIGKEFALEAGSNLIGRWDSQGGACPEIDLDAEDTDARVSRKHAIITYKDKKIQVEDLGSLNGTFLNRDTKLEEGERYEMNVGDELLVGSILLKLEE